MSMSIAYRSTRGEATESGGVRGDGRKHLALGPLGGFLAQSAPYAAESLELRQLDVAAEVDIEGLEDGGKPRPAVFSSL